MIMKSRKARYKNTLDEIQSTDDQTVQGDSLEGGENESKDGSKVQSPAKGG